MKNLYSVKSILFTENPQEYFNLHCPSCGGKELKVIPLAGKEGDVEESAAAAMRAIDQINS